MKYRVKEAVVDGDHRFYPQVKKFLTWKTIKTEHNRIYQEDGGVVTMYAAESRIIDHQYKEVIGTKYHVQEG